jgi:hypothetical protein
MRTLLTAIATVMLLLTPARSHLRAGVPEKIRAGC